MWHVLICCVWIREIGRDYLTSCACVKESTCIVIGTFGNGVLKALLNLWNETIELFCASLFSIQLPRGKIWETEIRWS
jgi:hypothetical protein